MAHQTRARFFDMTDQSPIANQINSTRTIRVSQGLFVLRYTSSKAGLNAPTVSVAAPATSGIEVISPGAEGARLVSPGDGLVIRAARDSFINVSVSPSHVHGSCDAELVLERVSTSIRHAVPLAESQDFTGRDAVPVTDDIEILAHVARRGDLVVHAGQWICGPQLPMAIEGLEIRWKSRPQGLDIVSRATINARGLRTLPEQSIGSLLGTRGRAAPITALTLALVGTASEDYSLACEAQFLGQPIISIAGKSCMLSGATGREPLVGLRLSVISAVDQAAHHTLEFLRTKPADNANPTALQSARAQTEKPSKVRIFRPLKAQPASAVLYSK